MYLNVNLSLPSTFLFIENLIKNCSLDRWIKGSKFRLGPAGIFELGYMRIIMHHIVRRYVTTNFSVFQEI